MIETKKFRICVVGLGYVGLPLAVSFSRVFETIGFDINNKRIEELKKGIDRTNEVDLNKIGNLILTDDESLISSCNFIVVAVPTPITSEKKPDLSFLKISSELVARNMKKGSIIVYESTVYPGATEEICLPILTKVSKLRFGQDFKLGYSPERINPGDKKHRLDNIVKVVSGSDKEVLDKIEKVYSKIVKTGVFRAKNIKTAEAAKVIENIQRDLNIALMNELSIIFNKLGIVTKDVIDAAGTKWNFHKYTPGLVGGHCIGVDPYYLTYKSEQIGYNSKLILAGRDINEGMIDYLVSILKDKLSSKNKNAFESSILVLGLTFKENVPDIRNSKSIELINKLSPLFKKVYYFDPIVESFDDFLTGNTIMCRSLDGIKDIDGIIMTIPHNEFKNVSFFKNFQDKDTIFLDVKGFFQEKCDFKDSFDYFSF